MLSHLIFMRHAKSSWDNPSLTDHERPLNKRGKRAAKDVSKALDVRGYSPDLIWSSDALRAQQTAKDISKNLTGSQEIVYLADFYQTGPVEILNTCNKMSQPKVSSLMLIGHNPTWGALYEIFTGRFHNFPTGACAVFKRAPISSLSSPDEDVSWLCPKDWLHIDLVLPRDLT